MPQQPNSVKKVCEYIAGIFCRSRRLGPIMSVAILGLSALFSASANAACNSSATPRLAANLREVPSPPRALQQSSQSVADDVDGDATIVGLWHVLFVSGRQPFDEGYDMWHSDGTELLNDTATPQPANGAGTICLGVYKKSTDLQAQTPVLDLRRDRNSGRDRRYSGAYYRRQDRQ